VRILYIFIMTCLNNIPQCVGKPQHRYIWCNYVSDGFTYIPEGKHTCNTDSSSNKFIDCCLENKNDCCMTGSANPTALPTIAPTQTCTDNNKYFTNRPITCAAFEKFIRDITFKRGNKMYCCAVNTSDCCELNTDYLFTISGVMLTFIILICVIMRKARHTSTSIAPNDEITLEIV